MKIKLTFQVLLLSLATGTAPSMASVQVYGEATSTGPQVSVQVFADITGPAIVSHSFKLYYSASQLQLLSAARNDAIWYFHDGTSLLPQGVPVAEPGGQVLFVSGHMDSRNPRTGVTGNRVLLGTVIFARSTTAAPNFDMTIGRGGQFASFVATNGLVLESQVGQVSIKSVASDPNDQDLDGLRDKWEDKFFGGTRGIFYSDDPDKDGVNNLGEEALGSDPNDPNSNLRLIIRERSERVLLEWSSAEGRTYTLEGGKKLGDFEPLKDGIRATPPINSLEFDRGDLGEITFFRLRLEIPANR
jgi:hypothetical protein